MSEQRGPRPVYLAGLDLGQASDFTALVVAEVHRPAPPTPIAELLYNVRRIQRWPLRTSYTNVIADVGELVKQPALFQRTTLIVDATGVGRPVVDAFRAARIAAPLMPILITGGDTTLYDQPSGYWRVPKRDLVGVLAVLLQNRRLKVAPALEHAQTLLTEMQNFKVKIDPVTSHDSYASWREGQHDDLVLATALLSWAGERWAKVPPMPTQLMFGGRR